MIEIERFPGYYIVEMKENTPITRFSSTYQCKLLEKLKERFREKDEQMFVTSFYGYL